MMVRMSDLNHGGTTGPRRPDLFIIGAPKAGTSSLYDYLSDHPDIYMSPVKEPLYFSPDFRGTRNQLIHGKDEQRYLSLFADARSEKRIGEASTTYLRSTVAPGLIKGFQPQARLVAMLRNPVELVYALHNERVSHGAEDVVDFEAAMAVDEARQNNRDLPAGANGLTASYKDKALFAPQLQRWIDAFGRERLHIIILEEFAANTPLAFRGLLDFLDVDPEFQPESFSISNRSHRLRGGVVRRAVTSPPVRWTRTTLLPAVIGQNSSARLARTFRHSRLVRIQNPRSPMPENLRQRLEKEFHNDVVAASELLGRDLVEVWFPGAHRTAPVSLDNLGQQP